MRTHPFLRLCTFLRFRLFLRVKHLLMVENVRKTSTTTNIISESRLWGGGGGGESEDTSQIINHVFFAFDRIISLFSLKICFLCKETLVIDIIGKGILKILRRIIKTLEENWQRRLERHGYREFPFVRWLMRKSLKTKHTLVAAQDIANIHTHRKSK